MKQQPRQQQKALVELRAKKLFPNKLTMNFDSAAKAIPQNFVQKKRSRKVVQ